MNRELLCRPFTADQIRQRPGQHGKTVAYVDIAAIIARLNESMEAWSFEVEAILRKRGDSIVVDSCKK